MKFRYEYSMIYFIKSFRKACINNIHKIHCTTDYYQISLSLSHKTVEILCKLPAQFLDNYLKKSQCTSGINNFKLKKKWIMNYVISIVKAKTHFSAYIIFVTVFLGLKGCFTHFFSENEFMFIS